MASIVTIGKYVVISPVKNEEAHVEATLRSLVAQTLRPYQWVIVDDGSSDRTPEIIERYARRHEWIQVLRRDNASSRQPGAAVIHAFTAGFEAIESAPYDFVVKLDCDVDLPANYFEFLVDRFAEDPSLGIASGVYLEQEQGEWTLVPMPSYHAAGASKMMRADCFRQIGGFVKSRGWDTVDEIRAQVLGWKTRHFTELEFHHLKREGSGIGSFATNVMHGEVYYLTGGGVLFFLLKVLHRMVSEKPYISGGLALLWGYVKSALSGKQKLVTTKEAQFYARLLNRRLLGGLAAR